MATATTRKTARKTTLPLLTRRQLAARLEKHMQTVTKWERDGCPVAERGRKGKPSLYREADVRGWLAAREEAAKNGGAVDLARERAAKEHWQAMLAEQTHRARALELLPCVDVERAHFECARITRDSVLNVADRISAELAAESDAAKVHARLRAELLQALANIADGLAP